MTVPSWSGSAGSSTSSRATNDQHCTVATKLAIMRDCGSLLGRTPAPAQNAVLHTSYITTTGMDSLQPLKTMSWTPATKAGARPSSSAQRGTRLQ